MGVRERLAGLDWTALGRELDERGHATTPPLLTPAECAGLVRLLGDDRRFRSTIDMARYRFGVGRYRYFGEPLPALVVELRRHAYRHLAPIAERITRSAREAGIAHVVPLEPAFRAYEGREAELRVRFDDGHWSALANRLIAAEVAAALRRDPSLLSARGGAQRALAGGAGGS